MKATGRARHRFWGRYSAHIVLQFESQEHALKAMPMLNNKIEFGKYQSAGGGLVDSIGWHHLTHGQGEVDKALFIEVADPALSLVVDRLTLFGAEKKKILSLARSIDYGEVFYIEMDTDDPNQLVMTELM